MIDVSLDEVRRQGARYRRALSRLESVRLDRDSCIRDAYERGASLRAIAEAVGGMTRQNVLRIVNATEGRQGDGK